jgi:MFS family permease
MGMSIETRVAVAGCILNMATKGTIGVFETLGSELGTTQYNWSSVRIGYTFALFGVMGVLSLLSFHFFIRLFGDINLVLFGMTLMIASCMVMIFMQENVSADYVQFYVALILMYSIGYPLGHTAVLGIVSKITTQGPQGRLLGWFGSAGSLARVIFPLMAGAVSQHYSEKIVFGLMGSILFVSCLSVVIFRNIIQKIIL